MSPDKFWEIVARVHSLSPDDMETKCRNLEAALRERPLPDVLAFIHIFGRYFGAAYTWDLWAAAFIIGHGCSDDSFMDFRSTLISTGKDVFTNALADPETLVDTNMHEDWAHFEGYQYVAPRLWREAVGEGKQIPPDLDRSDDDQKHPKEPAGERFIEWELSKKFPRLTAKFGYRDSDSFYLRDQNEKAAEKQRAAEALAELLLRAQLIPPNGAIPPFRLLRDALQTGSVRDLNGNPTIWRPLQLDEGLYWAVLAHLERLPPENLTAYPHIQTTKLHHDVKTNAATFAEWYRAATS